MQMHILDVHLKACKMDTKKGGVNKYLFCLLFLTGKWYGAQVGNERECEKV